jgi:hypothetical protein
MGDWKSCDRKICRVKESAGFDLAEMERHRRLVAAQNNTIEQGMHTVKGIPPAENFELINRFPTQKCAEQAAQAEDMIEVPMCQQYARQMPEACARLQNLALGTLTTINQKTIFIMCDDLGGKSALG